MAENEPSIKVLPPCCLPVGNNSGRNKNRGLKRRKMVATPVVKPLRAVWEKRFFPLRCFSGLICPITTPKHQPHPTPPHPSPTHLSPRGQAAFAVLARGRGRGWGYIGR